MYPECMWSLQEVSSLEDIANYCEVSVKNLKVIELPAGYVLLGVHKNYVEICDMASEESLSLRQLIDVISEIKALAGNKEVRGDFRATTSHRLITAYARMGKAEIISERPYSWGLEEMFEMRIRFK